MNVLHHNLIVHQTLVSRKDIQEEQHVQKRNKNVSGN